MSGHRNIKTNFKQTPYWYVGGGLGENIFLFLLDIPRKRQEGK